MSPSIGSPNVEPQKGRVLSVDFFRGVVMFFLIAEATGLYELLVAPAFEGTIVHDHRPAIPASSLERPEAVGPWPAIFHVHQRRRDVLFLYEALGGRRDLG